jgi:enolase
MRITGLRLRGILDSRAHPTVEAEIVLDHRHHGTGSSPVAIAPGRLERRSGDRHGLGSLGSTAEGRLIERALRGHRPAGQQGLDDLLQQLDAREALGADITLALSLAHARATCAANGVSLHAWLAELASTRPAMPRLLVNAFSGGIHRPGPAASFQQVMLIPATGGLVSDIRAACAVYDQLERRLAGQRGPAGLSASSGILAPDASSQWQLKAIAEARDATRWAGQVLVGIDVAAEHLGTGDGRYRLEEETLAASELQDRLLDLTAQHDVVYLEDPFDPADRAAWRALRSAAPPHLLVVGDDLFATDAARIGSDLANCVLLKPSQAGTLSRTLAAARTARRAGMGLVVSHRSGETEDTSICDLAVALGAELVKLGGPRRGDRTAKYNQLLRLAEHVPAQPSPAWSGHDAEHTPP